MTLVRSATAIGCLVLGLADLLYLNLAMAPALFEELTAPAAASAPIAAVGSVAAVESIEPAAVEATVAAEPVAVAEPAEPTEPATAAPLYEAATTAPAEPSPPAGSSGPGRSPEPRPASRPRRGRPIVSVVVHFARDRDELVARAVAQLERAAARLVADPSTTASIEGHTDRLGDSVHNLELSQRRAERVADHLVALGVGRERLIVQGLGERRPVERGEVESSRRNRRVEVRVVAAPVDGAARHLEEDAP